jgi:hypothetical protein
MESAISYKMHNRVCRKSSDGTIIIKPRNVWFLFVATTGGLVFFVVAFLYIGGQPPIIALLGVALVIGMLYSIDIMRLPTIVVDPRTRILEIGRGTQAQQIPSSEIAHVVTHSYEVSVVGEGRSAEVPVMDILVELNSQTQITPNEQAEQAVDDYRKAHGLRKHFLGYRLGKELERQTARRKKAMILLGRVSGKDASLQGNMIAGLVANALGVARDHL